MRLMFNPKTEIGFWVKQLSADIAGKHIVASQLMLSAIIYRRRKPMIKKSMFRLFFVLLMLVAFFSVSMPVFAGVDEDISEMKKEIAQIKKELDGIKNYLRSRAQPQAEPEAPLFSQASIDDDPVMGSKDAPLTLIEFSDYQCPFCGRFYRLILPQIKKDFIDTGRLKYVFRDFPLSMHPFAGKAAQAAQCSGEQGKYFDFHDKVFENQSSMNIDALKSYAKGLGLNMKDFNACLDGGKYADEIKKDMEAGVKAGVRGTPSFILGRTTSDGVIKGRLIRGAQPYQVFKSAIEELLKAK